MKRFAKPRNPRKLKSYYHASPKQFAPGDRLVPNLPNYSPNFNFSEASLIYLTEKPIPHYTVAERANRENWNIYEVRPINPKSVWFQSMWDEWVTDRECVVVKLVGSARGISKAGQPPRNNREKEHEEWLRKELEKAQEALRDPDKRKEWEEHRYYSPEESIEIYREKIKYKNALWSKAQPKRSPFKGLPPKK